METKIKIIKRADVAKRSEEDERQRQRRAEITMLQVLVQRYPEQAQRFVRDVTLKRIG